ncbi:MAG: hypothetical protein V1854_03625 [Methanobacteriota archaeon]
MTEDKSEIVKIIEERIRETVEAEQKNIKYQSEVQGDESVKRINGVYASILNTIKKLDIKDSSLLEFYTKAGGRVRSVDIVNADRNYEKKLYLNYEGNLKPHDDPIIIKPGKKYKVLFMAIEEGSVETK